MAWIWVQSTGRLLRNLAIIACGYSGRDECKNDPASESKHNRGPIPRGHYRIEKPRDTAEHGPFVMPLTPSPENRMYGRNAFLIHGDSIKAPGTASFGCIILDRKTREAIWNSNDHELEVIPEIIQTSETKDA